MVRQHWIPSSTAITLLTGALVLQGAHPAQADSKITIEPLHVVATGAMAPGTGSILVRKNTGVGATWHAFGLVPGYVYTAWLGVFNNPKRCATSPCTPADFANPAVQGSVIYGSGQIAGDDGSVDFTVFRAVGDTTGVVPGIGTGMGVLNAKRAEIHLVVRTHGPADADPAVLQEQLTTFNGGCPPNTCVNVQAAPHQP